MIMRYKIHYVLNSSGEYLPSRDARPQSDLQGLLELLQKLIIPDDVVYVYEISSMRRIQFNLVRAESHEAKAIVFELVDPGCGLVFENTFEIKGYWVFPMLVSMVEKVLRCDPEKLGFSCQNI